MSEHIEEHEATPREKYVAPQVIELDAVAQVTLGKYAEDTQDQNRYFE